MSRKDVAGVFIEKDNYLLMNKRRYKPSKGKLDFVGGFLEEGEDPKTAAIREVKEETGFDVELIDKIIQEDYFDREDKRMHLYSARIIGGNKKASEEGEPIWLDLKNIDYDELAFEHTKEFLNMYIGKERNQDGYAYMEDSYQKELKTKIVSVKDKFIVLEDTIFYPNSGGQPHDTGRIVSSSGGEFNVVFVGKFDGKISHEVDRPGLKEGEEVTCVLDWERRYALMKSHTSAHLLYSILVKEFSAKITGNQLGVDQNRMDFNMENYDSEMLKKAIGKCNEAIGKDAQVIISYMPKEEVLKDSSLLSLANAMPPDEKELRVIELVGYDKSADGGTHVNRIKEIGKMEFLKSKNQGKNNRRIYWKII